MPEYVRDLVAGWRPFTSVCIASGRGLERHPSQVGLSTALLRSRPRPPHTGPAGTASSFEIGPEDALELEGASYELDQRLREVRARSWRRRASRYRCTSAWWLEPQRALVEQIVQRGGRGLCLGFRLARGKLVYELLPDSGLEQGPGAACGFSSALRFRRSAVCPVCLGDDRTDEDMFRAARGLGRQLDRGRDRYPDPGRLPLERPRPGSGLSGAPPEAVSHRQVAGGRLEERSDCSAAR